MSKTVNMAMSKSVLPLGECLSDWAAAKQFERVKMGDLYYLKESFWFIPKKSTGSDVRYPSVVIAWYILKNHGVTVGDEDDLKGSLDSGVGVSDETFEDEVFLGDDREDEDDRERFAKSKNLLAKA